MQELSLSRISSFDSVSTADTLSPTQGTAKGTRAFLPSDTSAVSLTEVKAGSQERLAELANKRGNSLSLIPRLLGGLSLGLIAVGTAVAGGVLALAGGVTGAMVSLPVALGKALFSDEKGALLRTIKSGTNIGADAGMKLARLPLEILGYALKFPGAVLNALAKKITPSATEQLGAKLLGNFSNKQLSDSVLAKLEQSKTLDKLMASKPALLSADDVKKQVLIGEQLVTQILNDHSTSLPANNESVTAITWYLTAKAVETTGETYTRGTFNWVDQDHKLMSYMASAPTCHGRISTHFDSRSLSPTNFMARVTQDGILSAFAKSPVQYGIEDFGVVGSLPNGMHAILFDAMASTDPVTAKVIPQTMMKLETFGMPTANRFSGHSDSSWDILGKLGNAVLSLSHCAQHGLNFINSKIEGHAEGMTFRESATKEAPGKAMLKFLDTHLAKNEGLVTKEDRVQLNMLKTTLKKEGIDTFLVKANTVAFIDDSLKIELNNVIAGQTADLEKRGSAGAGIHIRQGGEVILSNLGNPQHLALGVKQKQE